MPDNNEWECAKENVGIYKSSLNFYTPLFSIHNQMPPPSGSNGTEDMDDLYLQLFNRIQRILIYF